MPERAWALIDKNHIQKEALPGQFWQRSESGKRWELWGEYGPKRMPYRLTYINTRNILWVIPNQPKQEEETNEL